MLADAREPAGEPVAQELLDRRRERLVALAAPGGDEEHAPRTDAAKLAVELLPQTPLAPVDRLGIRVLEGRHDVLGSDVI